MSEQTTTGGSKQNQASGDPWRNVGEIVAEIDVANCGVLRCDIVPNQDLRGRYAKSKIPHQQYDENNGELNQMPDIPGLCFVLDARRRIGKVIDPLSRPEHDAVTRRVASLMKSKFGQNVAPDPDRVYENMSDHDIKTWLYHLGNLQRAGHIKVLSGKIPMRNELDSLPGKTRIRNVQLGHPNGSSYVVRYLEDLPEDHSLRAAAATV